MYTWPNLDERSASKKEADCTFCCLICATMGIAGICYLVVTFVNNPMGLFGFYGNMVVGVLVFFLGIEFNERRKPKKKQREFRAFAKGVSRKNLSTRKTPICG